MKQAFKVTTFTALVAFVAAVMGTFTVAANSAEPTTSGKKTSVTKVKPSAKSKAMAASHTPPAPLPSLGGEELAISQRVETGKINCELGANVTVTADATDIGYFNLETKGKKYKMAPVISRVGAIRLEEVRGGDGMWLQLANKSMLMRSGSRVADECMSTGQTLVADAMKTNPPPSLLEADPAK